MQLQLFRQLATILATPRWKCFLATHARTHERHFSTRVQVSGDLQPGGPRLLPLFPLGNASTANNNTFQPSSEGAHVPGIGYNLDCLTVSASFEIILPCNRDTLYRVTKGRPSWSIFGTDILVSSAATVREAASFSRPKVNVCAKFFSFKTLVNPTYYYTYERTSAKVEILKIRVKLVPLITNHRAGGEQRVWITVPWLSLLISLFLTTHEWNTVCSKFSNFVENDFENYFVKNETMKSDWRQTCLNIVQKSSNFSATFDNLTKQSRIKIDRRSIFYKFKRKIFIFTKTQRHPCSVNVV